MVSAQRTRLGITSRRLSTLHLQVPRADWAQVRIGVKTEFRFYFSPQAQCFQNRDLPTPVVGYSRLAYRQAVDTQMLVLESLRTEPLGAISPASLEAEGFQSVAEFRAYWKARHQQKGYRPLSRVVVYQVRPFVDEDRRLGYALLESLYGPYLP